MKKSYFSGLGNCLKPLLKKGVQKGVFSGVAVGIYHFRKGEEKKHILCHGKTRNDEAGQPIKDSTLFDLASLTKPLSTVQAVLYLIDKKLLSLDTPIIDIFGPETGQISKNIKITHLLSHSSGIKAYAPFYLNFEPVQDQRNKKRLLEYIFSENKEFDPGEKCIYSDLGYILLGEIVERRAEKKIDDFFHEKIAIPLGVENELLFRPIKTYSAGEQRGIAATQNCPWRKRILQGEVDDEHCWLLKGVAGHAGLFGTIKGVLAQTADILDQWKGRKETWLYGKYLLQSALRKQYSDQSWCLGFDTPSATGSSGGEYISDMSVGHLGFTGTSFWIDPEKDLVIVLLTNRVHPTRSNERIKEFRPHLHNTVYRFLQE